MKANAPEKIYLQENTTTDCYGEFWPEWFEARAKDSDIEYIRTDAFIEKACFYIKNMVLDITYSDVDGKDNYNIDEFIEDFRNYMKGE